MYKSVSVKGLSLKTTAGNEDFLFQSLCIFVAFRSFRIICSYILIQKYITELSLRKNGVYNGNVDIIAISEMHVCLLMCILCLGFNSFHQ